MRAGLASIDHPALERLHALVPLNDRSRHLFEMAISAAVYLPARKELLREGHEITEMRVIVDGWAARMRILPDGRRQLLSFLLPGDIYGLCDHPHPLAVSSIIALTKVATCSAPPRGRSDDIDEAYAKSRAYEEVYLLAQITRLGRLNAQERISDLLLELNERLEQCGIARRGAFVMPLTQETLAEALGLTTVHFNRTLQLARRSGDIEWRGGKITIPDPAQLARKVGHAAPMITAA